MFLMTNAALNYAPQKLACLNTRVFNANDEQIFYQETEYFRRAHIVELSVSYALNMNGSKSKKGDSTFGKEQF